MSEIAKTTLEGFILQSPQPILLRRLNRLLTALHSDETIATDPTSPRVYELASHLALQICTKVKIRCLYMHFECTHTCI